MVTTAILLAVGATVAVVIVGHQQRANYAPDAFDISIRVERVEQDTILSTDGKLYERYYRLPKDYFKVVQPGDDIGVKLFSGEPLVITSIKRIEME
jgi:hypothetical protein